MSNIECGCRLLRFLEKSPNTLRTADDVAYHLKAPHAVVSTGLDALTGFGLARKVDAPGLALFGFTRHREKRLLVRELCEWQERWHVHMSEIERLLDGESGDLKVLLKGASSRPAMIEGRGKP